MLACVDVDYREHAAVSACLSFTDWPDETSHTEWVVQLPPAAPYQPGQFYRRELPCLLAVLERAGTDFSALVIDSYVWLDDGGKPGLGAHLYEALGRRTPIIGVAKTAFAGSSFARPIHRGQSRVPLHVTAVGLDVGEAAACVQRMHGPHRVPTLLRRVDRLCREG